MNHSSNPYRPPEAVVDNSLPASSARPKSVKVVVILFLGTFPLAIARLILGGHSTAGAIVFGSVVVGAYLAWLARRLYQGRRWTWWWVIFSSMVGLVTGGKEYADLVLDTLSVIKVAQGLMVLGVLSLLLTPTLRAWYLRTP